MTIINVTLPFGVIKDISDYSRFINEILSYEITLNIIKFSKNSNGTNLLIDIPEDKIKTITESLKNNNIIVNKRLLNIFSPLMNLYQIGLYYTPYCRIIINFFHESTLIESYTIHQYPFFVFRLQS